MCIRDRLAPLCLWAVFAFFLLGKLMLNPRFYHYGFVLAMPSAIFLVVLLVWFLPSFVSMLHGRARLVRVLVVGILAADLGYYVFCQTSRTAKKLTPWVPAQTLCSPMSHLSTREDLR